MCHVRTRLKSTVAWRGISRHTSLAEYDGKFSAEYSLYLWWCQQYRHCDYNNLCNWYKFQEESKVLRHSVMIEDGMDVISCLATMEHERNPLIGKSHGKYAYKPKYIQQ